MKPKTLQEKLNKTLKQFKDKTAIVYGDKVLTYRELDLRTNSIAVWIMNNGIKKGIQTGNHIGILLDDKIEFISVLIAVLKAGCVFVPLDPSNPAERLERMIKIADVNPIISDASGYEKYLKSSPVKTSALLDHIKFLFMEEFHSNLEEREPNPFGFPGGQYSPEDDIYICFTSGTTGLPKAVKGKNKSLLHFAEWERDTFHVDGSFRLSQVASTGFDAFLKEVFLGLISGAALYVPGSRETVLDPDRLIDYIEIYKINMFHCVPAIFRLLNSHRATKKSFPNLEYVLISGDTLYPADLENWYPKFGDRIQLVNLYGTTETTILKSYYVIQKSDTHRERIPIGKPIKDSEIMILDQNMNLCEDGKVGEIYIRTPYRTSGYYKEPELNKAKFIQNPLNHHQQDDILYKTGDMAKSLPDGNIVFLERMDRQVKIRGNRLELGEIESLLMRHPQVKEAVVIKIGKSINNERLIGYVTVTAIEKNEVEKDSLIYNLQEYLSRKLPDYMVPAHIIKIDEMPRKPNGKVDYDALSTQFKINEIHIDCAAPKNPVEKKLLEFWVEIIGTKDIGTTYNFFELGGNSINVMSLISKVQGEFDIRMPVREVFRNPTIEELAGFINREKRNLFL